MKTNTLSSYNIYEFECDDELTNKVLADIKQQPIIWKQSTTEDSNSLGYLGSKDSPVPYYYPELFDWFDDCVQTVADIHFDGIKFAICDSWLTKSYLGQQANPHNHSASIYSGLFYLTTHRTAETYFIYQDMLMKHQLGNCGNYSRQKQYVSKSEKNKLLIFPSDLIHGVNMNKDITQLRHTLAFNTYYDGVISSQTTRLLDIKVNSVKDKYEAYINKKNNETM